MPFKGLLAFEEADEEIFFGREYLTDKLVARVVQPPGGSNIREVLALPTNFLASVGASSSGKSSVGRAEMNPQLRRQTNWPIHHITPAAQFKLGGMTALFAGGTSLPNLPQFAAASVCSG